MDREKDIAVSFRIADPVINGKGQIVVDTNYADVKKELQAKLDKYKDLALTEDNIALVELVKKEVRATRLAVDKSVKEYMALRLELPVNTLKAQKKDMLDYIDTVESHIDSLLAQYDQSRIDALNFVYNEYKKDVCAELGMNPDTTGIVLGDEFYLKGARTNQKALKQKIRDMILGIKSAREKHDSDVKVVTLSCGDTLDAAPYIRQLEFKDVSAVLLEVSEDRKRREEPKAVPSAPESKKAGAARTVTVTAELSYEASKGKAITAFFKENGIKFRIL